MDLTEQIDDSTFCTMNDEAPTRIMGTCNSSPDIIIASGGLINSITRRPMPTLASDHLPIIISIEKPPDFISMDNRSFINFNKANWVGFTEFTESTFNALPIPTDVIVSERQFRKVIVAATARFIPVGRMAELRNNFQAEAAVLANERDTLRHANSCDPRIRDLSLEIWQMVNQHKRTKWIEHLKSCNLSTGVSKLWTTVKTLSNSKRHDDRVEFQFDGHASCERRKRHVHGLNIKPPCKWTILQALDLSKAFDTVNLNDLLEDIEQSTLPPGLKRCTMNYLSGRHSSVLSGNGIDGMCSKVNSYLSDLFRFFSARGLTLSPTKSTATIFTNWTKEYRLDLNILVDATKIPTVNNLKILGKDKRKRNIQGDRPAGPKLCITNTVAWML
nr:LOW QUALITY PROTEIN: uncharacterized protein LOC118681730 [Bactrocera oleae]